MEAYIITVSHSCINEKMIWIISISIIIVTNLETYAEIEARALIFKISSPF